MRLFVALGNPGARYELSRHNFAWLLADRLEDRLTILAREQKASYVMHRAVFQGQKIYLCRPLTFMNHSGIAVANALGEIKADVDEMVIMHDDIDIPFGRIRVKTGGGHGGHKGLISVMRELGRPDFTRLRLGIGVEPKPLDVTAFVLAPFSEGEMSTIESVLDTAADATLDLVSSDPLLVMNRVNRRERKKAADAESNSTAENKLARNDTEESET